MKPPELSVAWSPSIDTKLLFDNRMLTPSPDDLPPLVERLGLKVPNIGAVALLRREELELYLNGALPGSFSPAPPPTDALRVYIGELSEQNILEGFAHALVARERSRRRMNVFVGGIIASVAEFSAGAIIQQAGSYWGLLGILAAGATLGSLGLWLRGQRNAGQVMPSLDGLESPVRITYAKSGR